MIIKLSSKEQKIAKAAFAAGEQQGIQMGRKEVVEWVEKTSKENCDNHYCVNCTSKLAVGISSIHWRAKCKEWGIIEEHRRNDGS